MKEVENIIKNKIKDHIESLVVGHIPGISDPSVDTEGDVIRVVENYLETLTENKIIDFFEADVKNINNLKVDINLKFDKNDPGFDFKIGLTF